MAPVYDGAVSIPLDIGLLRFTQKIFDNRCVSTKARQVQALVIEYPGGRVILVLPVEHQRSVFIPEDMPALGRSEAQGLVLVPAHDLGPVGVKGFGVVATAGLADLVDIIVHAILITRLFFIADVATGLDTSHETIGTLHVQLPGHPVHKVVKYFIFQADFGGGDKILLKGPGKIFSKILYGCPEDGQCHKILQIGSEVDLEVG